MRSRGAPSGRRPPRRLWKPRHRWRLRRETLGPNPYRGLEAFRKEDADRFFGREALVDQLWNTSSSCTRLRPTAKRPEPAAGDSRRLWLGQVLGALRRGCLRSWQQRPLPGRPAPLGVVLTPEARPLESLAVALARLATDDTAPAKKATNSRTCCASARARRAPLSRGADARRGGGGLILWSTSSRSSTSLCDDAEQRGLHRQPPPGGARTAWTRLDHPDAAQRFSRARSTSTRTEPRDPAQNVLVPVMGEEDLRRAIEEPAKRAGREHRPEHRRPADRADRWVAKARCPLLEFVLTRIWDGFGARRDRRPTRSGSSAESAARWRARRRRSTTASTQKTSRSRERAFLAMVRLGEGTRDTRRRAPIAEMVTAGATRRCACWRYSAVSANRDRR